MYTVAHTRHYRPRPNTPRLNGTAFKPLRLDYGSTYASKFERLKDGRLIINTVGRMSLALP